MSGFLKLADTSHASLHGERPYTDALAVFCAGLRFADIPMDVVRKTKLCILDSLGTILAGATTPMGRNIYRTATRFEGDDGIATILGMARKASPPAAALVNGTLSEIFELQDGWRFGNNHPCVVIPAALALAEWKGLSGRDLIAAVVAGYEVTNRLSWAVHPRHLARGFLPTGTAGTCGSAVAAGRLLGFDGAKMAAALGVAGFILPVSTAENLWAGYSAKPLHSGYAAKLGIEAALLADDGFAGCPIEGSAERGRGFLEITTEEVKFERILDRLGEHFTVRDVYFKAFPACRHAHGTAEASLNIGRSESYAVAEIEKIRVLTYDLSASLLNRYTDDKSSMIAAQFSIPYVAAAALADRALGTAQFAEARIHDKAILALSRKVEVAGDPALNARYPEVTPTRVEVTLRDGRVLRSQVDMPKGDPRVPVGEDELFEKFSALAGLAVDRGTAARILGAVLRLEDCDDVRSLTALASGQGSTADGADSR
ncbi:MAG TPA: MmgE/PrpD family protein [Alphaproteobacteria bacterium]|nr:MmgE/PrpD family protein [Alphaproteobacteria bacterium]